MFVLQNPITGIFFTSFATEENPRTYLQVSYLSVCLALREDFIIHLVGVSVVGKKRRGKTARLAEIKVNIQIRQSILGRCMVYRIHWILGKNESALSESGKS